MTTRTTGGRTSAAKTQTRKAPARGTAQAAAKSAPRRTGKTQAGSTAGAEADSPILPVEQLDALRKIKPGAVDWVIEQTQIEADHRRAEQVRLNNLIFVEHVFAQASALIVGVTAIGGGVWLAERGQPWVGVAIVAVVMAALALVQVSARPGRT